MTSLKEIDTVDDKHSLLVNKINITILLLIITINIPEYFGVYSSFVLTHSSLTRNGKMVHHCLCTPAWFHPECSPLIGDPE